MLGECITWHAGGVTKGDLKLKVGLIHFSQRFTKIIKHLIEEISGYDIDLFD